MRKLLIVLLMILHLCSCGEDSPAPTAKDNPVKDYLQGELNTRIGYKNSVEVLAESAEEFKALLLRNTIRSIGHRKGSYEMVAIHDQDWQRFEKLMDDEVDTFERFEVEFLEEE
ncbi:MAG: hypothetical protein HRU15_08225 [Planctomycetes bacterium]|nr:hypothetical protein [Planctomycetota bacterium]